MKTSSAIVGLSLFLSACDPAPVVMARNATPTPITMTSIFKGAVEVKPQERIRAYPDEVTRLDCEYAYTLPREIYRIGAVHWLDIREDMKIYVTHLGGVGEHLAKKAKTQPPGWPLSPISKTCR